MCAHRVEYGELSLQDSDNAWQAGIIRRGERGRFHNEIPMRREPFAGARTSFAWQRR